jgi:hypothetical protein
MANILPKRIQREFFTDAEHFANYRKRWSWLNNSKDHAPLKAVHYLIDQLVRGKDYSRAFGEITNENKLSNGGWGEWGMREAYADLTRRNTVPKEEHPLAVYDGLVTEEMIAKVMPLLPNLWSANGHFADSYVLNEEDEKQAAYEEWLSIIAGRLRMHGENLKHLRDCLRAEFPSGDTRLADLEEELETLSARNEHALDEMKDRLRER